MTLEQVREYERTQQEETNSKLNSDIACTGMLRLKMIWNLIMI